MPGLLDELRLELGVVACEVGLHPSTDLDAIASRLHADALDMIRAAVRGAQVEYDQEQGTYASAHAQAVAAYSKAVESHGEKLLDMPAAPPAQSIAEALAKAKAPNAAKLLTADFEAATFDPKNLKPTGPQFKASHGHLYSMKGKPIEVAPGEKPTLAQLFGESPLVGE
jgi:hypothetical protein